MSFLEERIREEILQGSSYSEEYSVDLVETNSGNEFRRLRFPYPRLRYTIELLDDYPEFRTQVVEFFHKSGGQFGGFRLKHKQEYTTNNFVDAPTFDDQAAILDSTGVYQIVRWYGTEGDTTQTRRRIRKPVTGTILVGIRDDFSNPVQLVQGFTASTTTGLITFDANKTGVITAITQAASAVVTISSHPFVVNDSVHLSGVVGMTEINGLRGTVTAKTPNTLTVDIDSTAFTAYTSGGVANTRPQTNETVTAGCEFDIPARFETRVADFNYSNFNILESTLSLVEILNP